MRIVNLKEFLSLPNGTIFMKYSPCIFDDLSVKLESLENDFVYAGLVNDVESDGSGELVDILFSAEESGTSFNLDRDATCRDGMYEASQMFAIYELNDVNGLLTALNKYKQMAYTN
jgi:hypothetical protein